MLTSYNITSDILTFFVDQSTTKNYPSFCTVNCLIKYYVNISFYLFIYIETHPVTSNLLHRKGKSFLKRSPLVPRERTKCNNYLTPSYEFITISLSIH